jgi:hypothetical protein
MNKQQVVRHHSLLLWRGSAPLGVPLPSLYGDEYNGVNAMHQTEKERRREAKVASLIAAAERLEADIQAGVEEAVAEQDQVMAKLRNLTIFGWRGMSPSLLQRKRERNQIYDGLREDNND